MSSFFGKILLFGEYSVITGSAALTFPYKKYIGNLALNGEINNRSNFVLREFFEFLKKNNFDLDFDVMARDLENNLYFNSSIPERQGLGSSGALTAAVFHRYSTSEFFLKKPSELKTTFSLAESFFHGKSSGIDPLTSFLGKPVFYYQGRTEAPDMKNIAGIAARFMLFPSGTGSSTTEFVTRYLTSVGSPSLKIYYDQYSAWIDAMVKSIVERNMIPEDLMKHISQFQYDYFQPMIPEKIRGIWNEGLTSGNFYFKLCGSGGGGYFLIYTRTKNDIPELLSGSKTEPLLI